MSKIPHLLLFSKASQQPFFQLKNNKPQHIPRRILAPMAEAALIPCLHGALGAAVVPNSSAPAALPTPSPLTLWQWGKPSQKRTCSLGKKYIIYIYTYTRPQRTMGLCPVSLMSPSCPEEQPQHSQETLRKTPPEHTNSYDSLLFPLILILPYGTACSAG